MTIIFLFTATDMAGKSAFFHTLHSTNRHAKCLGFMLECGGDPNTTVSYIICCPFLLCPLYFSFHICHLLVRILSFSFYITSCFIPVPYCHTQFHTLSTVCCYFPRTLLVCPSSVQFVQQAWSTIWSACLRRVQTRMQESL